METLKELNKFQLTPPLNPMIFDHEVKKKFITNGGDFPLLMKVYKKNFGVLCENDILNFSYAGKFTEKDVRELANLMPFFTKLRFLIMHKTGVDDKAIQHLINNTQKKGEWENHCPIEHWVLSGNPKLTKKCKAALKEQLGDAGTEVHFTMGEDDKELSDEEQERIFLEALAGIDKEFDDMIQEALADMDDEGDEGEDLLDKLCRKWHEAFGVEDGVQDDDEMEEYMKAWEEDREQDEFDFDFEGEWSSGEEDEEGCPMSGPDNEEGEENEDGERNEEGMDSKFGYSMSGPDDEEGEENEDGERNGEGDSQAS